MLKGFQCCFHWYENLETGQGNNWRHTTGII